MSDNPTIQIFDDIEGLSWWESHEDLNKLYVGLVGLSYATEDREISHFVRKIRLPFEDIKGSMSAYLKNSKKKYYNAKLTHKLYENVHPSLVESAKILERLFILFDGTVESAMAKYGVDIQHQELDIERLAKVATYLYAMTSTLARASRTYSDGHPHNIIELQYAQAYVLLMEKPVTNLLEMICTHSGKYYTKTDHFIGNASDYTRGTGGYVSVHPLVKNMF